MKNLANVVKRIVDKTSKKKSKLDQISKLDEATKVLDQLEKSGKATYQSSFN